MQVLGVENVARALRQNLAKHVEMGGGISKLSVIVGYTANYALYVHENTQARHNEGQTAKYLENPARELNNSGELRRLLTGAMKRRVKLQQALFICGLRIQRESQLVVPVDTGNLRGSAFTKKE